MSIIRPFMTLSLVTAISSCGLGGGDENYDTAGGYDTSNPYGVPSSGGVDASYQAVNPPADDNPTYGAAAYEEAAPAVPSVPSVPAAPTASAGSHTIVSGDTLWGLSKKYGVSVDAIRAANGMAASDSTVRLGQTINIPAN
ncbi:LysM peptidoglycan-binding domain-containing protein [Haloferula chungangensis]|uniref:LysM peptidoglycan-binding domain-containing protein n=1 Tax=Haloferula chungangensis TaxID=1048331 RepID=A0ABW2LDT3_9BACT